MSSLWKGHLFTIKLLQVNFIQSLLKIVQNSTFLFNQAFIKNVPPLSGGTFTFRGKLEVWLKKKKNNIPPTASTILLDWSCMLKTSSTNKGVWMDGKKSAVIVSRVRRRIFHDWFSLSFEKVNLSNLKKVYLTWILGLCFLMKLVWIPSIPLG